MRYQIQVLSSDSDLLIREAMSQIGVTPEGIEIMAPKGCFYVLRIAGLSEHAMGILKQEMLAKGGEVAVPRNAAILGETTGEVLLMGTVAQFGRLMLKLKQQPFGLSILADDLRGTFARLNRRPNPTTFESSVFQWGQRTYVMGIINMTPDSFSGDGLDLDDEERRLYNAVEQAKIFKDEGADLLDLGGESTRPGATTVDADEERRRILPAIRALKQNTTLPISVDTQKAVVAEAALEQGAHIINDIWGLQGDPAMARVIGDYGAGVVLMHNSKSKNYIDLMGEIITFLDDSINLALKNNISQEKIWVDPGIGFGKTREQNLEVIDRLDELKILGCPILLGTSRKSVIGLTLNLPVDQRLEGTAATVALGVAKGADILRVHDVQAMVRTARMADAIVRRRVES